MRERGRDTHTHTPHSWGKEGRVEPSHVFVHYLSSSKKIQNVCVCVCVCGVCVWCGSLLSPHASSTLSLSSCAGRKGLSRVLRRTRHKTLPCPETESHTRLICVRECVSVCVCVSVSVCVCVCARTAELRAGCVKVDAAVAAEPKHLRTCAIPRSLQRPATRRTAIARPATRVCVCVYM